MSYADDGGPAELTLDTQGRQRVGNWVVAGLAMSAVTGRLRGSNGHDVAVHSFSELLSTAPSLLWNRIALP